MCFDNGMHILLSTPRAKTVGDISKSAERLLTLLLAAVAVQAGARGGPPIAPSHLLHGLGCVEGEHLVYLRF